MPDFVTSSANELGIARLVEFTGTTARLEYFVSPATGARKEIEVPAKSIQPAELFAEARVYCFDPARGTWRAGRLLDSEPVPAAARDVREDHYLVGFPNGQRQFVPASELFLRWALAIEDPTDWLSAAMTETPFWHQARARFMHLAIAQRAAFGGLTALASASIELYRHQVDVVRRILHDPVQRYVLADEVGLGKTIEAGIILRQYFLDDPAAAALVVVPEHLVDQWRDELRMKFHFEEEFGRKLHIIPSTSDVEIAARAGCIGLLIVDEAHQIARWAYSASSRESQRFAAVRAAAESAARVLLLSATPLLHNEDAFLAMLHLLDPTVHRLDDLGRFRALVATRQRIAEAFQSLQDDAPTLFVEETLDTLAGLPSTDPRMGELCEQLRALVDSEEEDEQRVSAIRALRAHISELYRLDRRLLRTSREATDVANDLPKRVSASAFEHECAARAAVADVLESWRRRASFAVSAHDGVPGTASAHVIFAEMLENGLTHPSKLHAWMIHRVAELDEGRPEAFDGERAWLADNAESVALAPKDDQRLSALTYVVEAQRRDGLRSVIFVDDPAVADAVLASLLHQYPQKILRAPFPSDAESGAIAVVCDRNSEEGLNLQGERSAVVHFDLPLSPNRIEQRIGRVDRIGAKSPQVRSIALISRSTWEVGWAACLEHGVQVFSRSVAALQYVLDENMRTLRARLLHDGPLALEDATRSMADEANGLGRELSRIRAQATLDSIEHTEVEDTSFFERLEASDDEAEDETPAGIDGWAVDCLQFERRMDGKHTTVSRYVYVPPHAHSSGHSTLLPATAVIGPLRRAVDVADSRPGSERYTHLMTASRRLSTRTGVRLLRLGNPFVDGLVALAEVDDRGIAWALWRHVPGYQAKERVETFFRFDFVVLADAREAATVVRASNGSVDAVRRRADAAFPPQFVTVWVRRDGTVVNEPRLLELLGGEYQKKMDGWVDVNLNVERWAVVASRGLLQGWESAVLLARERAEEELRTKVELERRCLEAARQLERTSKEKIVRLTSRLAQLGAGPAHSREAREIDLERRLCEALVAGIRCPVLRPDAAGAIFMSSESPLEGRST